MNDDWTVQTSVQLKVCVHAGTEDANSEKEYDRSIVAAVRQTPPMQFKPVRYVWLFRLTSSAGGELRWLPSRPCRSRPTFRTGALLLFARKLTMQTDRNLTRSRGAEGFGSNIPTVTTEDTGFPLDRKQMASNPVLNAVHLRAPSPLAGVSGDDDSEAESFKDGRTEEVDRDTRGSAFSWCRDFLSGSWKTIQEDEFQISIVR